MPQQQDDGARYLPSVRRLPKCRRAGEGHLSYEVERSAAWPIRQGPDKPGHGCDLPPWLADVDALDPPTERVKADRVRERTTDVQLAPRSANRRHAMSPLT